MDMQIVCKGTEYQVREDPLLVFPSHLPSDNDAVMDSPASENLRNTSAILQGETSPPTSADLSNNHEPYSYQA